MSKHTAMIEPQRICMIVHQDFYCDGRVRRYTEALTSAGFEVDIVATRSIRHPAPPSAEDGVRVYQIPLRHGGGGAARYLYEYAAGLLLHAAWVTFLHARRRYSAIHVHNMPDFLVLAAGLPRALGVPVILDVHDPTPEFFVSKFDAKENGVLARCFELQERISVRFSNTVVAANEAFKRFLIGRGADARRVTVVHNFPDSRLFDRSRHVDAERSRSRRFRLVYPGTIAPRYGLDIAIKAMPRIRRHVEDVELVIIGSHNAHADELGRLARELGVHDIVDIRDVIPVSHVPAEIACSSIGIYTAQPDPYMDSVTPTKVLEYAYMGIPIVAARLPGVEEIFGGEAVAYFEPGDAAAFADRVIELHANPARRTSLVAHADAEFVAVRTWQAEADRYLTLLRELGLAAPRNPGSENASAGAADRPFHRRSRLAAGYERNGDT